MTSRISQLAPPPSSYSPLSPSDPNNVLGKDNASSTRSNRSSTFSFKHAKGFKRVFGLLGKDSSGSDEVNANAGQNASRLRGGRRESESGVGARNAIPTSTSSPLNHGAQSRIGNEGGPLYRSRNARSMDALKLFSKSAKPQSSSSKSHVPGNHRPSASSGSMDTTTEVIIIRPNGRDEKDMPVLRLEEEDADDAGNGSTSTGSDRSTGAERNSYMTAGCEVPSIPISGGIGGPPPPGAKGAVHLPPSRPPPPPPPTIPTQYERNSTKAASESTATNTAEPPQARSRPSKPSLSIPIPPRTSHEKAISASAILPSQSPVSISSAGPPSHSAIITPSRTKSPPSPGHGLTFRLTPSIVMNRPVWPLPPLPPMPSDMPPVPSMPGSLSGADGNGVSWNMSNGKSLPMFRLIPPTRSMTGPTSSTSASELAGDGGASVRRSVSVKLNAMPSLNVMGETEVGDPEADDMMDEDEEEDDMEEEEEMPIGRPSIDSVISMDSVVSVETVRAPPPPPLSMPSPSRSNARQIPVGGPIAPADKGKGKAKKEGKSPDEDGDGDEGSASDSDDSVYFDARGSVFLSPRDVAKALERRASQISQRNSSIRDSRILAMNAGGHSESGLGMGRREGLQDISRERRDSSWSFSTTGRESVYLTPSEGSAWSAAATPHGSAIVATASDLANSGFAKEVSSKRSSVPVGFGATVGGAIAGSIGSRRGAGSRFSMLSAADLPSIDSSSLNFDASSFAPRTPTPGLPIKSDGGRARPLPSLPDGLPTTRREGLPNFELAVPVTGKAVDDSEATTPKERDRRTPKSDDYFNARMNYPPSSSSGQRRRGSVSASVSVPAPIAEDAVVAEQDGQQMPLSPASPLPSSIPSAISQNYSSITTQPRRPSVYRQASRSMVDLSTSPGMGMDDDEEGEIDHKADASIISGPPALTSSSPLQRTASRSTATHVDPMAWLVPPPSPSTTRPSAHRQSTLRRVSSVPLLQSGDMPITVAEKPPPAYHAIPRREEEGKEVLPPYSNDIILAGLLHRKMEFDRPGLQARDRSWRKVWCVLQGTGFRVYKVGTLEAKFGALAAVPVAGSLPPTTATAVLSGGRVRGSTLGISNIAGRRGSNATAPIAAAEQSGSGEKGPLNIAGSVLTKNQQKATSPSLLLAPPAGSPGSPASTSTSAASRNSGSSHAPSRASFSSSRPTTPSRPVTGSSVTPPSQSTAFRSRRQEVPLGHGPGGRSVIDNGGMDVYTPMQSALLRQYSLQSGESGLATDYMKRRNVIRVRLEGEQFLLQMPGVEEVVEWIEGFQAAANVALDLDVRTMPRGPLYPRRRRRRRPRQPGEPATQSPLSPPPNPSTSGTTTPRSNASQTTPSSAPSS